MGAPKNNKFWLLRSKHGRDKIFESPEVLLEACMEYFEQTSERVWNKIEFKGSDVQEVKIPTSVPFTLSGLCIFLDIDENTWQRYRKEEPYKDFRAVVSQVEKIIYTQKFEGAVVGAYNANIIARDLGLVEKSESKSVNIISAKELTIEQAKEYLSKLDDI